MDMHAHIPGLQGTVATLVVVMAILAVVTAIPVGVMAILVAAMDTLVGVTAILVGVTEEGVMGMGSPVMRLIVGVVMER